MDDLLDDEGAAPGGNAPEFSVSDLTGAIKKTLEGAFGRVRVRGEIGRVVRARSGHLYYDIKDDRNVINCTTWKGQAAGLGMVPEEGLEVIVTGRLSAYGPQSRYNLNVDRMEVAGEGALMALLEKRRKALAGEGLFDEGRKKALPFLPEIIGVVTSPSGAVIRDILHRLRDRFPRKVLIWPVAVQGERCAAEVARAIKGLNALTPGGGLPRPDLIIVARGGGSLEDLWGFNEEAVVRAAAESDIPLISAVGHETDTTLIDFASDKRAPTPTAAAEMAVPVRMDLLNWLQQQEAVLSRGMTGALTLRRQRLTDLARSLPRPETLLDTAQQRLDLAALRLAPALRTAAQVKRGESDRLAARLDPALERALAGKRLGLSQQGARLSPSRLQGVLRDGRRQVAVLDARMSPERLAERTRGARERFAEVAARFDRAAAVDLRQRQERLAGLARLHQTLGYTETLRRGYAVVRSGDALMTRQAEAAGQARLEIEFADGRLEVTPRDGPMPGPKPRKPSKPEDGPSGQGSLF
jgi:exodeoxyribonuclease VII large subunit